MIRSGKRNKFNSKKKHNGEEKVGVRSIAKSPRIKNGKNQEGNPRQISKLKKGK